MPVGDGGFGLVTDALLRARVLVAGLPSTTPAGLVMDTAPPTVALGDSAAEALMLMLDRDAEFLLVTDRDGELRGVVGPRDFAISPSTAGVSLHEQLRRARTDRRAAASAPAASRRCSASCCRGASPPDKVIAVYSTFLDTITRRAIGLVFARAPGTVGRRVHLAVAGQQRAPEAVPSSDVDSAVAFDIEVSADAIATYRDAFDEVYEVLAPGRPECGRPWRHGAARAVLPDQRRLARARRAVAGGAGRARRRHDDVPAGRRPAHPRRPRPPGR